MNDVENPPSNNSREGCIQYYAVGVFDILGMSDRIEMLQFPLQTDEKETNEFKGKVLKESDRIEAFRASFRGFFDGMVRRQDNSSQVMRNPNVKSMVFSDTIVTYSPLEKDGQLAVLGLMAMIEAAGCTLVSLLGGESLSTPFRGGIEIDWGTERCKNEIFGRALVKAHKLEKDEAKWPRILVGENAVKFLRDCQGDKGDNSSDRLAQVNRRLANECLSYLGKDEEGKRSFIDYLGKPFRTAAGASDDIIRKALCFIQQEKACFQEKAYRNEKMAKELAERYEKLERYFLQSQSDTADGGDSA